MGYTHDPGAELSEKSESAVKITKIVFKKPHTADENLHFMPLLKEFFDWVPVTCG